MKKQSKLDLGRELSKNAQKQILGGIKIYCSDYTVHTMVGTDCTGQEAYCGATGHGFFLWCEETP